MLSLIERLKTKIRDTYTHEQRKWDLLPILFFCFLIFFIPYSTFDWDSYVRWADKMREMTLSNIYMHSAVNYMPINIFGIYAWQLICGWLNWDLRSHFHFIKIFPMLFDVATVALLYRFAKKYSASLLTVAILFLPNLAFHYNSFVWGQFDGIYTFFVLLSAYFILNKRPIWAFLAFVLALNSKIQAVIFWPALISFVWLHIFQTEKRSVWTFAKTITVSTLFGLAIQILLFMPFTATSPFEIIRLVLARSVSLSTWVTFNADNFWTLIGVPSMTVSDTERWVGGITYHTWGYLLFVIATGLIFLPLLGYFLAYYFPKQLKALHVPAISFDKVPEQVLAQIFSLILYIQGLSFFYFLTQMHERYSHPAIVFAGLFAVLSRKKMIFILTCLAYVINLERIQRVWATTFDLSQISWIGQFSALLYLISLVLAFRYLYALYLDHSPRKRSR